MCVYFFRGCKENFAYDNEPFVCVCVGVSVCRCVGVSVCQCVGVCITLRWTFYNQVDIHISLTQEAV
jgi:hypothetical protein